MSDFIYILPSEEQAYRSEAGFVPVTDYLKNLPQGKFKITIWAGEIGNIDGVRIIRFPASERPAVSPSMAGANVDVYPFSIGAYSHQA